MAGTVRQGVSGVVAAVLKSTAAGFAFGEAASFAVHPALADDGALLSAAALATRRAGSTGVGVVAACLLFTSVLFSLGDGFLLASGAMKVMARAGARSPWVEESVTGASVVLGAVTTGALTGILPPWIYIAAQGAVVLTVYSYSNINDMTVALLIIFTTIYVSVIYGRMGVIIGLLLMLLTICFLYMLRKALTKRMKRRPQSDPGCRLLERIFFYSVCVGILGFSVGVVAGEAGQGTEAEVVSMLHSVLWVAHLSAALLGAGLGTVAMVGLGPEAAGKVSVGAAVVSSLALRAILQSSSFLGPRSSVGGALGAAAASGVSLGAASVSAKQAFQARLSAWLVSGSVAFGAVLAVACAPLTAALPTTSELIAIALVGAGAFVLGAPKSPFHTQVNLRRGLLTGPELIKGIGMETVTAAAAPIGAGALGAAALGTAALGRLGTVGVVVATMLALGSILGGVGKSPANSHSD